MPIARPDILLTNDDGVDMPELLALKNALAEIGQVVVVAPDHNWSAAGHTKTMHKPLRMVETRLADGSPAYTTNGAPSDCVSLAILGLLAKRPNLVVSGINRGANLGYDITASGTVGAAMEGVIFGLPAIAVSLDTFDPPDPEILSYAARFAACLAEEVLQRGLPEETLLNVNVPYVPPGEIEGLEITRQGQQTYQDKLIKRQDPLGLTYYWLSGEAIGGSAEEGSDIGALARRRISITPIHLDLTAHPLIEELKAWKLGQRLAL
jgi:5'-nucleotidase